MERNDELASHIRDLADRCYNRGITVFSSFLSLAEQSEILAMEREFSFVRMTWFGGMEGCERKMLMFSRDGRFETDEEQELPRKERYAYEEPDEAQSRPQNGAGSVFPICCLIAKPLMAKFADSLCHRDFLGALMNLGINREVLGDIVVKDKEAYIFCNEKMAGYICENFIKVKHTNIRCEIAGECPESAKPVLNEEIHIIASNRCDAIIAKIFNLSRSRSSELFRTKSIFIDGRQCENSSAELKEGAAISVRGYGKFVFDGITEETRKGRIRIRIRRYT